MKSVKIIKNESEITITVKGSKFISYTYNVNSKENIDKMLSVLKKEHYKSTHICYAYRIGKENITEFSTDAGEPPGTAGKPILGVAQKYNITDTMLVVVRYFGGTKLGIRGLIDAYGKSAEEAVKHSTIKTLGKYKKIKIKIPYTHLSTIEYQVRNRDGLWINPLFGNDGVNVDIAFDTENYEKQKEWFDEMLGTKLIETMNDIGEEWVEVG